MLDAGGDGIHELKLFLHYYYRRSIDYTHASVFGRFLFFIFILQWLKLGDFAATTGEALKGIVSLDFSNRATAEAEEKMGNANIKGRGNVNHMPTNFFNFQIPVDTDENLEDETRDDSSSTEQTDSEELPEVCDAKPLKVVRNVTGEEWMEDLNPGNEDYVPDVQAGDDKQTVAEQQPEKHRSKSPPKGRKAAGEKRRRSKPLPLSICFADTAESGTSFEYGVRRSTRIRMRPLKYWKGERFLYGCINNSAKQLIGVKYMSDREKLEVVPFMQSDLPEYKEELELAARH